MDGENLQHWQTPYTIIIVTFKAFLTPTILDLVLMLSPTFYYDTWTWWGTSALLTPVFDIFRSHWVPFLSPTRSYCPPLSAEKIGLSLSHLVREIIWSKVGQKFHKNLSFDHFEAFVPIFSLIFDLIDPFLPKIWTASLNDKSPQMIALRLWL